MFDKALTALDLSPAEQPILDCLPALQDWGVRHLVLTHVIQIGYMQGIPLAHKRADATPGYSGGNKGGRGVGQRL